MDEHTLNDLLECSVCLDRLNTSSKVLPCQHTFCRKCLEVSSDDEIQKFVCDCECISFTCFQVIYASRQELRCPECRILVDTKIEDLPPNVLLMRILEGMYYVCNRYCIFYKGKKNSIPFQTTHTHTKLLLAFGPFFLEIIVQAVILFFFLFCMYVGLSSHMVSLLLESPHKAHSMHF